MQAELDHFHDLRLIPFALPSPRSRVASEAREQPVLGVGGLISCRCIILLWSFSLRGPAGMGFIIDHNPQKVEGLRVRGLRFAPLVFTLMYVSREDSGLVAAPQIGLQTGSLADKCRLVYGSRRR